MKVHRYEILDSTNDEAKRLLAAGRVEGSAGVVARGQTNGRGTRGRAWASPPGAGVYLSLIETHLGAAGAGTTLLTLAAGVACAEALARAAGVDVRLKPVNDLCAGGGKLGGILTEVVCEDGVLVGVVTGVGINLRRSDRPVVAGALPPVSLEELMEPAALERFSVELLVDAILERLGAWHREAVCGEPDVVRLAWTARALPGVTTCP